MTVNTTNATRILFEGMPVRRLIWRLLSPVRAYVLNSGMQRGKGLLLRYVLIPTLPGGAATFEYHTPTGAKVKLEYRETLGRSVMLRGDFEASEQLTLAQFAKKGTTAFDVGANVGVFSVGLARAVGEDGSVIAVEPVPATVRRLEANASLNQSTNMHIIPAAVGDKEGAVDINITSDSAFNSLTEVFHRGVSSQSIARVKVETLDSIWTRLGRPSVSVIKIDVEGAELSVLRGATVLLKACHPVILLEAATARRLDELAEFLTQFGYAYHQPSGFEPWNYLFDYQADQTRIGD